MQPRESDPAAITTARMEPLIPQAILTMDFPQGKALPIDTPVKVKVAKGAIKAVTVVDSKKKALAGTLAEDGSAWVASDFLASGEKYSLTAVAHDKTGLRTTAKAKFSAEALPLDRLTYPTIFPEKGAKVGVAMPVVVNFDIPVKDRKAFEERMKVTSTPAQAGSFSWFSDREVHWRPKEYWKPGTKVEVDVAVQSVPAGNGVYGQYDRKSSFTVGRSQVVKVNMKSHRMKVFQGDKKIKDLPTSTGSPGYTTRTGTKVIMAKHRYVDMNSASVGIDPNSSEGYDLSNVEFAMRLTNSGEFIHAAPWNAAFLGNSNQSHGCTGLSMANASWLFKNTLVGDPIEYTGSDRKMTKDNGYGDWNVGWEAWKKGSAL